MAYTFKHGDRPLDGITIQRAVGRGGFGEVYYALSDSGKQLAIKYLRDNPEVELRGISHVMNLKSPHLITIYDVRRNQEDVPFVMMEYVGGPSLRDLLVAEPGGLGPQKAAYFLEGIGKGLAYLHERGIVHRDLKPGNIFYDDGYVKIGDYGLSKHIAVSAHSGNTVSVGTVHYMAPEIGSGSYTKAIDIYAMGVMLYEMLSGTLPFTGSSMGEILMRHLSENPDVSGLPEPFASVIAKALEKDPADRFQDVNEMIERITDQTEISKSLASFDASVLTSVPRVRELSPHEETVTKTPSPEFETMDVRGVPELPPIPPMPNAKVEKKMRKLRAKAEKIRQKANQQVRGVRNRMAAMGAPGDPSPGAAIGADGRPKKRRIQLLVGFIVLMAASGLMGVVTGNEEVFGTSLLFLSGGMIGAFVGNVLSVRRGAALYDFQDRLLYGACGFVFMLPGFAVGMATHDDLGQLVIPLVVTMLLFDWNERIRMGRMNQVQGGAVFGHGLAGFIVAAMASGEGYMLVGAGLCAALLVLVQTVAAYAPLGSRPAERPNRHQPKDHGRWAQIEQALELTGKSIEGAGARLEQALHRRKHRHGADDHEQETAGDEAAETGNDKPEPRPSRPAPSLEPSERPAQPSFVGRTANAGLSFLAKAMFLSSLALALLYSVELIDINQAGTQVSIGGREVFVRTGRDVVVNHQFSRAAAILPLALGTIFLVIARRRDGVAHFLRGLAACLFGAIGILTAVGPASVAIRRYAEGHAGSGDEETVVMLGIAVAASLIMLFWPKRRGPRPIVI